MLPASPGIPDSLLTKDKGEMTSLEPHPETGVTQSCVTAGIVLGLVLVLILFILSLSLSSGMGGEKDKDKDKE
jgi:hypothetical protein